MRQVLRSRRAGLSAVLSAALLASAPAHAIDACDLLNSSPEDWKLRVPFEVIDGRIYVQASVNGSGPFRFAVDTGASGMGRADTSLVSALGLTVHAQTENSDGVASAKADMTRLSSLEMGGIVHRNLDVITRDYSGNKPTDEKFSGILGREFFSDGLLVIDYPNQTLYFSQTFALAQDQPGVIGYERAFRIPVTIGDVRTTGNLDTGANVTFVLPQSLYEQLADTPLQRASTGTLSNTSIETGRAQLHGPFRLGEVTLSDVEVRVSDRYPELLVGAHVLQQMTVMIDQRSRAIALCQ
jgi:predicted aspartyl protease